MAFTAQDVKKLREMTNVGMMDCKKALTETDGDMDKAVDWLRLLVLGTNLILLKPKKFWQMLVILGMLVGF